ncbi:MAG: response regulator [Spirochaetales bacterium]|nr:response regulator [Spirochaetales bacterium]
MNLAINARDAMSLGGRLLIKTKNVELNGDYCKKSTFNITPGEYIEILISDTGVGMDKKTMDRIFEPFFTTKSEGKGTGLGLAATYGIVNEHKGEIYVESTLNKGTVFTIVLPIAVDTISDTKKKERKQIESGEGCILIVDDEYIIRSATSKLLEKTGYEVLTAEDGMEAIEIYKKNMNSIDIILLDLIMPHKSGKDTYYELKAINSDVKIIISSGYTPDINTEDLLKAGARGFIKKPYKWEELAIIIKKVLQPH